MRRTVGSIFSSEGCYDPDEFIVASVSTRAPKKRLDVVLTALRRLKDRVARLKFLVVGGGSPGAASWEVTDWRSIVWLYGGLARMAPSPVVELNRAVAISMVDGPEAGLTVVDRLRALHDR